MVFLFVFSAGCSQAPATPPPAETNSSADAGSCFDPQTAGAVRGRVIWGGKIPHVQPFTILPVAVGLDLRLEKQVHPNVNAPAIDPANRGVGSAVVFLRGIDPARGRSWNQPPVQVEMRDQRFLVHQGPTVSRFGFVHRGHPFEMVSHENVLHILHASGAAFFTLAFPDPDRPLSRPLAKNGVVELTSASTYYWMRAYLFVDDHPYYTRTAPDGSFALPDVPPGSYELVCWMPNWHEKDRDLDPEMGIGLRLFFHPPIESIRTIRLNAGENIDVDFTISREDFRKN
jgi:hypothetical protein